MTQPGWCTTTKAADVIRDLLARIQALEREVEDWRATYRPKSALVKELEAAEARVQALEAERDHERHEKETVADSSKALVRYLRAEVQEFEGIAAAVTQLVDKWRKDAKKDALYGVSQPMKSDREYYGTVNAAFAIAQCADELAALLGSRSPETKT